ncbi:MAG: hypothetical protein ACHQM7_03775 [Vicinamibacterales bacterium]
MSTSALPIACAWCDRVRTLAGRWEKPEAEPRMAPATHGICPECLLAQQREARSAAECHR